MNPEKKFVATTHVDYLIIGQGLAGSCLALQLIFRGKTVMVYDQPSLNKSSLVAAGLFNPIVGKVMTRGWRAERVFPYLMDFYPAAEKLLGQKFFFPMQLYRPFNSVFEQNEWMAQSADSFFTDYVDSIFVEPTFRDEVFDPFGGMLLKQCGYLDVPSFIETVRNLLIEKNSYQATRFDSASLQMMDNQFQYHNLAASKIAFCGGMEDNTTDFFSWLPLKPLKGETLTIKTVKQLNRMYNNGVYVVPIAAPNHYKVGATYNPNDQSGETTNEAFDELTSKLDELLSVKYKVLSQEWGFRPCAIDRKPYLGEHPSIKNMYILNGLGTKGVSLAPHFSNQLADFMEFGNALDTEATITRFKRFKP